MKKLFTLLSIITAICAASTNNLFAQDTPPPPAPDEGAILITEEDEEYCPFCNAIAAAQANNLGCIIVLQAPDGSVQMSTCPPAKPKDCKTCKPCPKCKTAMPKKLDPKPSPAEISADKALMQ